MKNKFNPLLPSALLATASVFSGLANHTQAETRYQWNGSPAASSDWNTAENWSATEGILTAGPGASNTSGNYRLNVFNGAGATLTYSADQGDTTYANTESGGRGLVISLSSSVTAGTLEIIDGNFSTFGSSAEDVIGNAAAGTLMVSGGSFTGAGPGSWLGLNSQNANGISILTLSGSGSATFTTLKMAGYKATVNLDGGTLTANQIVDINDMGGAGNSDTTFNFNGGTLKAGADAVTAFMTGLSRADVLLDGAFIDTNGKDITIGQSLLAPVSGTSGGVTKTGAGTLTLSGTNTYTGDTTVSNGTLELADNSQLQFVVTDVPEANKVTGTGTATFHGDFNIDTAAVSGSTGYIWLLVDRANLTGESFGSTFSVNGFADPEDDGTWIMTDAKGDWLFDEATGELSLDIGSDYDDWVTANGVLGGENDDDDNDGLTNHEEYAFGLDPTGGSSVNPILVPLNKSAGTFTYQRRKPSLTGLTSYKILSSTDLVTWIPDDTAGQVATDIPATENESVVVTLTTPPTAAKFFVRVSAE